MISSFNIAEQVMPKLDLVLEKLGTVESKLGKVDSKLEELENHVKSVDVKPRLDILNISEENGEDCERYIENGMNLIKAERESLKMRIQELQTQLD